MDSTQQITSRRIACALWGFSGLALCLVEGQFLAGRTISPFTGTVLVLAVLVLSALAGFLHRQSFQGWSADLEVLNTGATLVPPMLLALLAIPVESSTAMGVVLCGLLAVGSGILYQADKYRPSWKQQPDSQPISSSPGQSSLVSSSAFTSNPGLKEGTSKNLSPGEQAVSARESETLPEPFSPLVPVANSSLEDTQIIDIPVTELVENSAIQDDSESSCVETDRSYDLFGEDSEWVTQQFRRTKRPTGCEALEGFLKVDWEAGQKTSMVHIPFSPPFAACPEIYCETADDSAARLKVAASHTYGTRIEIRLPYPAKSQQTTCIHLLACSRQSGEILDDAPPAEDVSVGPSEGNQDDQQDAA